MSMLFDDIVKKKYSCLSNSKIKNYQTFKDINLKEEILEIFNTLAEDSSWSFENLSRKETSYVSHGYHRYPAKFIPQLAKRCILSYSKENEIVCDPFMGCGTSLVEALVSERKAIGVDINPVAWLITMAKTTPIEPIRLKREVNSFLSDIYSYKSLKYNKTKPLIQIDIKPVTLENERIKYWFPQEDIRKDLGLILGRINKIEDENIKNFFLCAFSQILKNCSVWLMKSIKPTRDLKKKIVSPFQSFRKHINYMMKGNEELYRIMPKKVKENLKQFLIIEKGDARKLPIDSNTVSLIVTSPPYVTSYEYADLHQLTALWLQYTDDITDFREGFIGSIYKRDFLQDKIKSDIAEDIIIQLEKKSKRLSLAVNKYFLEMQQCFKEMFRVLKEGGKTCIVIGNTELKKVKILNAEVFVEIMLNLGYTVHKIIKRRIPSKILPSTRDSKTGRFTSNLKSDRVSYPYEYILVMEKP
ncbi:MAG: site-specific DNA-methyltransferase [Candidatus Heimdallarchaeum endolithica]|uniref:Type II methyltransferase n=1 Tax=Candidatus Heimdallarchaeum endolithica TaxID=2876572 RepID=A0A9Y1BR34_9ARCH|nr:MAG: site-specific DNA-methyltransferase [Candidatus Heimdallarchaeum endolithica]